MTPRILQMFNKPNQHRSFDRTIQETPNKVIYFNCSNVKPGKRSKALYLDFPHRPRRDTSFTKDHISKQDYRGSLARSFDRISPM